MPSYTQFSILCAKLYIHQRDQQFNYWAVTLSVPQDSSGAFESIENLWTNEISDSLARDISRGLPNIIFDILTFKFQPPKRLLGYIKSYRYISYLLYDIGFLLQNLNQEKVDISVTLPNISSVEWWLRSGHTLIDIALLRGNLLREEGREKTLCMIWTTSSSHLDIDIDKCLFA